MVSKEPCPEGMVRDRESKECREKKKPGRKPSRPPCPDNQIRNAVTKECREKKKPGRKSVEPQPEPLPAPLPKPQSKPLSKPLSPLPELPVVILDRKRQKSTPCDRVMTMTQQGGTCWFNALMMGIFYSQGMRGVVMKAMKNWIALPEQTELKRVYDTFKDIILKKFLHKDSKWAEKPFDKLGTNAKAFALFSPEQIMTILHRANPTAFFNKGILQKQIGGHGHAYIISLLQLLHVKNYAIIDERTLNVIEYHKSRLYGLRYYHEEAEETFATNLYNPKFYFDGQMASNPDILLIKRSVIDEHGTENAFWAKHKTIKLEKDQLIQQDDTTYVFNNIQYIVDSLYLTNFNDDSCKASHAIAGVTCNNKRFMYNGWARDTVDAAIKQQQKSEIACPLMELDWAEDLDFCIDMSNCSMRNLKIQNVKNVLCFNSAKGNRFIIAVRKDIYEAGFDYNRSLSAAAAALKNVCPGQKVAYNPATKSCEDISASVYPC